MSNSLSIEEVPPGERDQTAPGARWIQARDGDREVGQLRLTWGGDGDFSEAQAVDFVLAQFLEVVPAAQVVLAERLSLAQGEGDADLLVGLIDAAVDVAKRNGAQLLFLTCEPPQVRRALDVGFRTYTRRTVNRPEAGYLVPLVLVLGDVDYLRALGSPLAVAADAFAQGAAVPEDLAQILGGREAIESRKLFLKDAFWDRLKRQAGPEKIQEVGLFDGLTEIAIRACLENSTSYECDAGYRIITKGEPATNIFMVLVGTVEVRDGDEVVAIIGEGEAFGEIAFFLGMPRTLDVVVATNGTKVVSFSEGTIRRLIYHDAETATKLLLNISKMLCARLVKRA